MQEFDPKRGYKLSPEAYARLKQLRKLAEADFYGAQLNIGVSADGEEHDNGALDLAKQDFSLATVMYADVRALIDNAEVVQPCQETDRVHIGNTVEVVFDGETEPERYTLLYQLDALLKIDGHISEASGLGQAMLGLVPGQKATFTVVDSKKPWDKHENTFRVVSILPGQFGNNSHH